jgi:uncharacterized membrane protein
MSSAPSISPDDFLKRIARRIYHIRMPSHSQRLHRSRLANPQTCFVCGRTGLFPELVRAGIARPSLAEQIARNTGVAWKPDGRICQHCLSAGRNERLLERMRAERGRLTTLDEQVARRIAQRESVLLGEDEPGEVPTLGGRVADVVARGGGSWTFVLGFLGLLLVWAAANTLLLHDRGFDPYPYILLNLILSCVAALQAPIIMMSQNRAEKRDRRRAESDYRVNLKAEIEILTLHDKVDHLLHTQYEEMIELQEAELDLLEQLVETQRR